MKKTKLFYFILLMLTWIILTCSFNPYQLLLGAATCVIVTLLTHGLISDSTNVFISMRAVPVVLWYMVLLAIDIVKTNVIIAGRLLLPHPVSETKTMVFQSSLSNPLTVTLLSNTLSLIYDTAVVTVSVRTGELLVQYVVQPDRDAEELIRKRTAKYQVLLGKLS